MIWCLPFFNYLGPYKYQHFVGNLLKSNPIFDVLQIHYGIFIRHLIVLKKNLIWTVVVLPFSLFLYCRDSFALFRDRKKYFKRAGKKIFAPMQFCFYEFLDVCKIPPVFFLFFLLPLSTHSPPNTTQFLFVYKKVYF